MEIYIIYRNRKGFKNIIQRRPFTEFVNAGCKNKPNIYRNCKNPLQKSYLKNKLMLDILATIKKEETSLIFTVLKKDSFCGYYNKGSKPQKYAVIPLFNSVNNRKTMEFCHTYKKSRKVT